MTSPTNQRMLGRRLMPALVASALLLSGLTAVDIAAVPSASAHGSLGTLPTGDQPFWVASAGGFAYVSNRIDGTVTVIDMSDWSIETTITVGTNPTYVSASSSEDEIWVTNLGDATISIIETGSHTVTATLSPGGSPRQTIFTADGTTAYVVNSTLDAVSVVDSTTHAISTIGAGVGPMEMGVLNEDESELILAGFGADRVIVLDLTTGTFDYSSRPSLGGAPRGPVWNPDGTEIWIPVINEVTNGSIAIMDSDAKNLIDTIPLPFKPDSLAFSATGTEVYVTAAQEAHVELIDVSTRGILARIDVGNGPAGLMAAPGDRIAVVNADDDTLELIGFDQERLAGANRFATAVEVSKRTFASGASTVFVANGLDFPDALAAGPAAGKLDASLLLTNPTALPAVVAEEITRLNPDTIYIVGGTGAVSASVEAALKTIQPNTIRLAGANRYATGVAIVQEAWEATTVPEVFIATGRNYPDALSAGAVAAAEGIPVILVDGALSSVPASTLALIAQLDPAQITIAGGTGVVSAAIMQQLTTQFGGVRRLAGADRYATSAAINLDAYPTNAGVIYATGTGFADALAGAALAGRADIPVYLVKPTCVPQAGIDAIYAGQATNLFLLGGTGSLSTAVENLTVCP